MSDYKLTYADVRKMRKAMNQLPGVKGCRKEVASRTYPDRDDLITNQRLVGGIYSDAYNEGDLGDLHEWKYLPGLIEMAPDDPLIELDVYLSRCIGPRQWGDWEACGNLHLIFNTETKEVTFGNNIYD